MSDVRLAVDIGGTFTDLVLEANGERHAAKTLTTHDAPARGVMGGVDELLSRSGIAASAVGLVLHGTTLATNALIERRGARTALLTTAGHRDVLEMALENRFEQYDLSIDRPQPLVPRHWRRPVPERIAADGTVLLKLDAAALDQELEFLAAEGITSLAVGFLHAYRNPAHEQAVAERLARVWPSLAVTLSSEVCPEIREYERFSTTCANAYVLPLMADYLEALEAALRQRGFQCPLLLMTSGGGLTDLATAQRYPIRLVESGPAGGAMLAADLSRRAQGQRLLSFDMGGTTAKLCLINDGEPVTSRSFEVDRVYRFKKGSGLPVRIPVVEMVEIGAGGGSLATVDALQRIQVGPASAGSEPGPALYGRGGTGATVTDADHRLGRLPTAGFVAAGLSVDPAASLAALRAAVAEPLDLDDAEGACAITEVVDENMAAASRAHASEWGQALFDRWLVAFGGAAPLHAARLAEKTGIRRVLVPALAGVGSALGFLLAPVRYEVARSDYRLLTDADPAVLRSVVESLTLEAQAVVEQAAPQQAVTRRVQAYMRYAGQGYEIAVTVPDALLEPGSELLAGLREAFDQAYTQLYTRGVPGVDLELLSWAVSVSAAIGPVTAGATAAADSAGSTGATGHGQLYDPTLKAYVDVVRIPRTALAGDGTAVSGPLLVTEAHTTTVVPDGWCVRALADGTLALERREAAS
ncbi:MAG: hydantoinase/oxoprolinase family protein [Pseudomonadota bacterium]